MQTLIILGRQPHLGLAELECLFGAEHIFPIIPAVVLLDVPSDQIPFHRLGGSIKMAKVLDEFSETNWNKIENTLLTNRFRYVEDGPSSKITLGLSVYGISVNPASINKTALKLKKNIKSTGRSVRIVPNQTSALNSAQVIHNRLIDKFGMELVVVVLKDKTIMAQTVAEQDIETYAARDQQRPKRDALVGMLPPKLAQIIINLAVGKLENVDPGNVTILDPFCGTGVILQEALLMRYKIMGTDIDSRMIDYTTTNLNWLTESFQNVALEDWHLSVADATTANWTGFNYVACESYLGTPFSKEPSEYELSKAIERSDSIIGSFFKNLAAQVNTDFRACVAVPTWHIEQSVRHLPCLSELERFGWRRIQLDYASYDNLIYRREDQVVGRELVIIERV